MICNKLFDSWAFKYQLVKTFLLLGYIKWFAKWNQIDFHVDIKFDISIMPLNLASQIKASLLFQLALWSGEHKVASSHC